MAAETIRKYLESGTIRHSVNFPDTNLPEQDTGCIRVTVVNKNVPGMLSKITEVFANHNMNIVQQINQSRDMIAYTVVDVDTSGHGEVLCFKNVQERITMLPGVLSSRVIYGRPGTGYAKHLESGEYFV